MILPTVGAWQCKIGSKGQLLWYGFSVKKKIIVQSILSPYKEYRIKPIKPLLCLPYIRPLSLTCVDNWILFTITLSVFYAYQLFSSFLLNKYLQSSNQILSCPLNFREGVLQCIWYHLSYSFLLIIFWYKEDTFYNKRNGRIKLGCFSLYKW